MVQAHLDTCAACREEFAFAAAIRQTAHKMAAPPVSDAFRAGLHQQLVAAANEQAASGWTVRIRRFLAGLSERMHHLPAWACDWRTYGSAVAGVFIVTVGVMALQYVRTPTQLMDTTSVGTPPVQTTASAAPAATDGGATAPAATEPAVSGADVAASQTPHQAAEEVPQDSSRPQPDATLAPAQTQPAAPDSSSVQQESAGLTGDAGAEAQSPKAEQPPVLASEQPPAEAAPSAAPAGLDQSAADTAAVRTTEESAASNNGGMAGGSSGGSGGGGGGASGSSMAYSPAPMWAASMEVRVATVRFTKTGLAAAQSYLADQYPSADGYFVISNDKYDAVMRTLAQMEGYVSLEESSESYAEEYQSCADRAASLEASGADSAELQPLYDRMAEIESCTASSYILLTADA